MIKKIVATTVLVFLFSAAPVSAASKSNPDATWTQDSSSDTSEQEPAITPAPAAETKNKDKIDTKWTQDFSAYGRQDQKPKPTSPDYIVMIFSKLAHQQPDFEAWAHETQAYQNAPTGNRPLVLEEQIRDLKNMYSLLTLQEPIIVETPVKLSSYSTRNKGFFVDSFKEDTFFPVKYNNRLYAIVPQGIIDKQWLKVPDADDGKAIENASLSTQLTMVLTLYPKYADTTPAELEGGNYWLISTEVQKMALYAPNSTVPLWQSDDSTDKKHQEILKLRQ